MKLKTKYRKAVFIITYRKEKNKIYYLILKRKLHWTGWEFPKGGIEKYEHISMALKRELKEETGQTSKNIIQYPYSGRYKYYTFLRDRPGYIGQEYKLFSAEIKNKKVKIDKREHNSYKWVNYKQALKLLKWENQKKCLRVVNNYLIKNPLEHQQ